jgi:hypothetical protein
MEKAPDIKPIKTKEYDTPKSKYSQLSALPTRSIILGPSGSGKSILLQNMILDLYKGLFKRIYIFSPSVDVDYQTWKPVKDHIEKDLKITETDEETIYFSEYNSEALEKIITTQRKITEYQKKQDHKKLYQILIVIDDFADSPEFSRHSKILHALFTRGRHSQISTIVATQKFTSLHPIIRVNASELYVFRLRNFQDLETFLNEISALIDKKSLLEMYKLATSEQYSFLYCKLTAKDLNKTFMIKFNQYLTIEDDN